MREFLLIVKPKWLKAMNEHPKVGKYSKRLQLNQKDTKFLKSKDLSDFAPEKSLPLSIIFGLSCKFLKLHPSEWGQNQGFNDALKILKDLKVVIT